MILGFSFSWSIIVFDNFVNDLNLRTTLHKDVLGLYKRWVYSNGGL